MNFEKPIKEGIIQQLNCLSKRYDELLKLIDETGNPIQPLTSKKPWWTALFKKRSKKTKKTVTNDE